jgi:hypothetical protein
VATLHTRAQCKFVAYFLSEKTHFSAENKAYAQVEITLGKRKEQILSDDVELKPKK